MPTLTIPCASCGKPVCDITTPDLSETQAAEIAAFARMAAPIARMLSKGSPFDPSQIVTQLANPEPAALSRLLNVRHPNGC